MIKINNNNMEKNNYYKSNYYLVICAPSILTTESRGDAWHPGLRSFFWLRTNQKEKEKKKTTRMNISTAMCFTEEGKRRNKSRAVWEILLHRDLEFKEATEGERIRGPTYCEELIQKIESIAIQPRGSVD